MDLFEFEASQCYRVRACLKKEINSKKDECWNPCFGDMTVNSLYLLCAVALSTFLVWNGEFFFCLFEVGSHSVAWTGLKLTVKPSDYSWLISHLDFPNAGITGSELPWPVLEWGSIVSFPFTSSTACAHVMPPSTCLRNQGKVFSLYSFCIPSGHFLLSLVTPKRLGLFSRGSGWIEWMFYKREFIKLDYIYIYNIY